MTISSALRSARAQLKVGDYICIVLQYRGDMPGASRAAEMISSRLAIPDDVDSYGHQRMPCAERWLESQGFVLSREERFEWRLKWLDSLIAEFEAKND